MVAPPTCSTALGWTGVTNQQTRSTAVRHRANHGLGVGAWACVNNPLRTPVLSDTDRTCERRWLVADADGKTGLLLLRCILTIDECTHQWYLEEEQQPSRPKRLTMGSILRCRNELASFKISISSDTCNNPKARAMGAHSMFSSEALFFQELGSLETLPYYGGQWLVVVPLVQLKSQSGTCQA